ncbi:MAG TPA: hypothetical protein VNI77_01325 [Nitrososphaera sp.]|nr:hypothetical protein [Nitrososphaera sp.]
MRRNHFLCTGDVKDRFGLSYYAAYQAVARYLRSGSAMVYAAEDIPPEETLNDFSKVTNIDADDYIMTTMKLVYRVEEEAVIMRPQLFADTLEKTMGENTAATVLVNVLNKMKEWTAKDKVTPWRKK